MRWPLYFLLAYVMLGLQLGLGGFMAVHSAEPNLMLLVVVLIALTAPRDEALIGCILLGAMQDLVTLEPMGLYAFAYGLVGFTLASVADSVEREHPLTHLGATAVGGILWAIVILLHQRLRPAGPTTAIEGVTVPAVRVTARAILGSIVYTALLSPLVLGVLQRTQRMIQGNDHRRPLGRHH